MALVVETVCSSAQVIFLWDPIIEALVRSMVTDLQQPFQVLGMPNLPLPHIPS
jgi:hypothetical protein